MSKKISFRNGAQPVRFWNIASAQDDEATITLYGDIVSEKPRDFWTGEAIDGQYICPEDFAAALETIKDKKTINIKINSVGGDVYTGIAIHNALKALKGTKNVIVEGVAMSAASVIAMAGDSVKMYPGSIMMIHGVSAYLFDYFNITDLKKMVRNVDACERAIASIYSGKTGTDEATIRGMMEREKYMTGAEAVAEHFADELLTGEGPSIAYSAASRVMLINGVRHSTEGLTIPESLKLKPLAESAAATVSTEPKIENKGAKAMTLDELKAQHPELVAQIEAEAVAKDRARIQEIEEIQDTIGDPELVASAKFTKPIQAADLALAAMKKQAAMGADFLKQRKAEQEGAASVQASARHDDDPAALEAAAKAKEGEAVKNAADLYKKIFK